MNPVKPTREIKIDLKRDRIARGWGAINLHPDLASAGVDPETAGLDIVADILTALFDDERGRGGPQDFLRRALDVFEGDVEDDPEETCLCGRWPVTEYGSHCPSCPEKAR